MSGVVITGMGCVTPIGIGVAAFAEGLRSGASGVGVLTSMDPTPYKCRVAAEVRGFDPHEYMPHREARSSPRVVQLAVAAARLALQDARLAAFPDPTRAGVVIGSSVGPMEYNCQHFATFIERGARRIPPAFPAQAHNGVLASECAIQFDAHGPVLSLSSACTSGTDALGVGAAMIQGGMADAMLVGAAEAPLHPLLFAAFDRLEMMPTSFNDDPRAASRPFAIDREGFVLGEGAAIFVLERLDHARERGARIYAELVGHAATCDAKSHFSQDEGGADAERAVRLALDMAGVGAGDLDYVNAHGSATRQNDPFEAGILRRVLGEHAARVPVSSSKSMFGHLLGASGAVEVAATLVGMEGGFVPPTINLGRVDPECELVHVPNVAKSGGIEVALSTSFGFGSRNAAVVVRRSNGGRDG